MTTPSDRFDASWRIAFAPENRPILNQAVEKAIAQFEKDFQTPAGPYSEPPTAAEFQAGTALAHQVQAALQDPKTDPNGIAELYRQCLEHRRDYSLLGASLFRTMSKWHWLSNQAPQFSGPLCNNPIRISPWLSHLGSGPAPVAQTLAQPCEGEHTFQRAVPGSMHYARVGLRLEPLPASQSGQILFHWQVQPDNFPPNSSRDSIPLEFMPQILSSINGMLMQQVADGTPLTGIKITVQAGSYHPIDSQEYSYNMATLIAFKNTLETAQRQAIVPTSQGWWAKCLTALGRLISWLKSLLGR